MKITSTTFRDGETMPTSTIFDGMGQSGGNRSPQLSFEDVPEGTQSFAIVLHDPDAPTSGGFYHWVMIDIPGDTRSLAQGAGAKGVVAGAILGHNDFGKNEYDGPAPPPGPAHHYHITVYALDTATIGLEANATGALTEFSVSAHTLAKATITGLYANGA